MKTGLVTFLSTFKLILKHQAGLLPMVQVCTIAILFLWSDNAVAVGLDVARVYIETSGIGAGHQYPGTLLGGIQRAELALRWGTERSTSISRHARWDTEGFCSEINICQNFVGIITAITSFNVYQTQFLVRNVSNRTWLRQENHIKKFFELWTLESIGWDTSEERS